MAYPQNPNYLDSMNSRGQGPRLGMPQTPQLGIPNRGMSMGPSPAIGPIGGGGGLGMPPAPPTLGMTPWRGPGAGGPSPIPDMPMGSLGGGSSMMNGGPMIGGPLAAGSPMSGPMKGGMPPKPAGTVRNYTSGIKRGAKNRKSSGIGAAKKMAGPSQFI